MSDRPLLIVDQIGKKFHGTQGEQEVLRNINLEVYERECVCILGHSGCGKTTLLRIICAFESKDEGHIYLDGVEVEKPTKDIIQLFQDYNQLLPWKTVAGNIIHALCATTKMKRKEAKNVAYDILHEVGLEGYEKSFPSELSGGMKQRAAFARALVLHPRILVMDEPFANLDHSNRVKLQHMTREMCAKYGVTLIVVSHDIEETVDLANKIVVMKSNPGEIQSIIDNIYNVSRDENDKLKMQTLILKMLEEGNEQIVLDAF